MDKVKVKKIVPAFRDKRGTISDIIDDVAIKHIGIITSKAGSVRAKHYHKKADQYNYVLSGKLEVITKKFGKKMSKIILNPGDMIFIPRGTIHTVIAVSDCVFLDFNTESRSADGYESDTFRVEDFE